MEGFYPPKIKKKVKGHIWFRIIFVIVMIMVAVYYFAQPIWERLIKIITGD